MIQKLGGGAFLKVEDQGTEVDPKSRGGPETEIGREVGVGDDIIAAALQQRCDYFIRVQEVESVVFKDGEGVGKEEEEGFLERPWPGIWY